jgi:hypothetical protein
MEEGENELDIDAEAFLRFAQGRNLKLHPCPVCETNDFSVFYTSDERRSAGLVDVTLPAPALADMRVFYMVSLECKNCGNVRLFRRSIVEGWLRANHE